MVYKESDQPGQTLVIRSAWIDSQVRGFSKAICAFGYERFKKNCNKMVMKCSYKYLYYLNIYIYIFYKQIISIIPIFQVTGFNYVLSNMFPMQNMMTNTHATLIASKTSKLKDAAKNASELAKAKAAATYASLHPNQS